MKRIGGLKHLAGPIYEGKTPLDHVSVEEEEQVQIQDSVLRMAIQGVGEETQLVRVSFDLSKVDQLSENGEGKALLSYATGFSIFLPEVNYDDIVKIWAEVKK